MNTTGCDLKNHRQVYKAHLIYLGKKYIFNYI